MVDLAWGSASDFTLGAEDELLLVDDRFRLVGDEGSHVLAAVGPVAEGRVKGEIFADEVELETPVCADAEELARSLRELRRAVVGHGAHPLAVGLHPSDDLGHASVARSPRYDRIATEFAGLLRTPAASFQVHVGLPGTEAALAVHRALRNRLALFRALAAGTPYWQGRDSGHACIRPAILRSYPRTTMPPALTSWDDYVEQVERAMWTDELSDYTYVCWELRPHPRLGTIELRVMDAQHSVDSAAALAALVQGLARHAVEHPEAHDLPADVVLSNDFAACRHGMDATVVAPDGTRQPMRQVAVRALEEARRALGPEGLDRPLEVVEKMLSDPPEPERQRRLCEDHGMPALLADLVERTVPTVRD
jgi:carboxylate-amine ligase